MGLASMKLAARRPKRDVKVGLEKDDVIAALYSAAMGREEWPAALDKLAELTATRCVTIDTYDLSARVGTVLASNIAPHQAVEDYNREFGRNNPLIEDSLPHLYSGAVFRASQLIDNRLFLGSDLYNLVYRSLGLKHVMSVFLDVSPACTTQYTVIKPVDAPDFTDRELAVFEELKPHLIQSWHGFRHLNATQRHLRTLTELWDCFSHAVFVFDRHRRIHFANRAAERLLRESNWMTSTEGRFRLLGAEANQALGLAIAELSEGRRQIVSIPQCTGLLTLYRIGSDRVALLVTDTAQSLGWVRGLQVAFHLTPTEAGLVTALVRGTDLRHYADTHGIKYETARSHLKHAMQKNGWHRQSEMVSTILQRLLPTDLFDY